MPLLFHPHAGAVLVCNFTYAARRALYAGLDETEDALMKCAADMKPKVRGIRMLFEWRQDGEITRWQWLEQGEIAPTPEGAQRGWLLRFR
jgi:hypothetical protein